MRAITPRLFQISLGAVNCFIIDAGTDGLILVDTGYKDSTARIFKAIEKGGKSPGAIKHILLTHTHPDHAGSAADIREKTGAGIIVHPADAALAEQGIAGRLPHILSPGLANRIVYNLFIKKVPNAISPFRAEQTVQDGDILPTAGGIRVIHTPGHSAGHVSFYLPDDDVLIAGDICAHMIGLGLSTVYEDPELGVQSILKVARLPFGKAVFGHGKPLLKEASRRLQEKFS